MEMDLLDAIVGGLGIFMFVIFATCIALSYCAKDEEENVNFFGLKIPAFVFALWQQRVS